MKFRDVDLLDKRTNINHFADEKMKLFVNLKEAYHDSNYIKSYPDEDTIQLTNDKEHTEFYKSEDYVSFCQYHPNGNRSNSVDFDGRQIISTLYNSDGKIVSERRWDEEGFAELIEYSIEEFEDNDSALAYIFDEIDTGLERKISHYENSIGEYRDVEFYSNSQIKCIIEQYKSGDKLKAIRTDFGLSGSSETKEIQTFSKKQSLNEGKPLNEKIKEHINLLKKHATDFGIKLDLSKETLEKEGLKTTIKDGKPTFGIKGTFKVVVKQFFSKCLQLDLNEEQENLFAEIVEKTSVIKNEMLKDAQDKQKIKADNAKMQENMNNNQSAKKPLFQET